MWEKRFCTGKRNMTSMAADKAKTGNKPARPQDPNTKILDEDIERARQQIGIAQPARVREHAPVPCVNTIRNFAFGYGDDNPLWRDESYAKGTRWRSVIAPPMYLIATGQCETPPLDAEGRKLFRGLFKGVGKYYAGVRWLWFRPVRPNDPIYFETTTDKIEVKKSSFSQSRSVIETLRTLYVNGNGEPVAVRYEDYVNAERGGSKKAGKLKDIERQSYTPEEIEKIDAIYAAEKQRGAEPLYWEDVETGQKLTPVAKGPLTVTDIISMHMGWGWGGYGVGPLRLAWKLRQSMKPFFSEDEYGVPDVVQRLHWDPKRAQELGLPASYDYGQMRTCWLTHLITNWMGDDAWLWKLSNQVRAFNFLGDTHVCSGEVVGKYRSEDGNCVMDLNIEAKNQRGEITAPGTASIILPSRTQGPARLPRPPADLSLRGAQMMSETARRQQTPDGAQ